MKTLHVLGPGCPRCRQLAQNAMRAVSELGIPYNVEKVTDINEIAKYGIVATPALVVDGEVKSKGKVLSPEEIKELLA